MIKSVFSLVVFCSLLVSCNQGESKNDGKKKIEKPVQKAEESIPFEEDKVIYTVPSPVEEMTSFVKLDGMKKSGLVCSLDSISRVQGPISKAFLLGMYTADAAYLTAYKDKKMSHSYVQGLLTLTTELSLDSNYLIKQQKSLSKNKNHVDSLKYLTQSLYMNVFRKYASLETGVEVSFFMMGEWIESMHLMLNSNRGFKYSPKLVNHLTNQKMVADNLMGYLLDFQDIEMVSEFTAKLGDVLGAFDGMDCDFSPTTITTTGKQVTLKGGSQCIMNEELFLTLRSLIQDIRNQLFQLNEKS